MKNNYVKYTALVLSILLILGSFSTVCFAENSKQPKQNTQNPETENPLDDNSSKDESVYAFLDSAGNVKKILVSDSVKGKKNEFSQYETKKDLPVTMKVSYTLDGKSIKPEQLKGKSGHLQIRYDFTNHLRVTKNVNGKQESMYVPFVSITGISLDNAVFQDVTVKNAKLHNDGNTTTVVGITVPGMKESIDTDMLSIDDYFVINANVKNFSIGNTMSIISNSVFNEIDEDEIPSADALDKEIGELTDAMNKLMQGSKKMYDGLSKLNKHSIELSDGAGKLYDGAEKVKNGGAQLSAGIQELSDGMGQLNQGLETLSQNSEELNKGAEKVFDSLLEMANAKLRETKQPVPALTKDNYAEVLNGLILSLDDKNVMKKAEETARNEVVKQVKEKRSDIQKAVEVNVKAEIEKEVLRKTEDQVLIKILANLGMTKQSYENALAEGTLADGMQAKIESSVQETLKSPQVQSSMEKTVQETMLSASVKATIEKKTDEQSDLLIEQMMKSDAVSQKISAALTEAKSAAAELSVLKAQLDEYNMFYRGLRQYTEGVDTSAKASKQIHDGSTALCDGAGVLMNGLNALSDGMSAFIDKLPALLKGIGGLYEGSDALNRGLIRFNEIGINKLVHMVESDIAPILSRSRALIEIAKDYRSFCDENENVQSVKFLLRTDAIQ